MPESCAMQSSTRAWLVRNVQLVREFEAINTRQTILAIYVMLCAEITVAEVVVHKPREIVQA
jgi:hypothetical protein